MPLAQMTMKRSAVGKGTWIGRKKINKTSWFAEINMKGAGRYMWELSKTEYFNTKDVAGGTSSTLAEAKSAINKAMQKFL